MFNVFILFMFKNDFFWLQFISFSFCIFNRLYKNEFLIIRFSFTIFSIRAYRLFTFYFLHYIFFFSLQNEFHLCCQCIQISLYANADENDSHITFVHTNLVPVASARVQID